MCVRACVVNVRVCVCKVRGSQSFLTIRTLGGSLPGGGLVVMLKDSP